MGVYVKGMKMPKDHLSCPFRGAITEMCIASEKWCNGFNEDCPLVEVPASHGRLIDAKAANDVMLYEMCGTGYQSRAMSVLESEYYSPTIIEEENCND